MSGVQNVRETPESINGDVTDCRSTFRLASPRTQRLGSSLMKGSVENGTKAFHENGHLGIAISSKDWEASLRYAVTSIVPPPASTMRTPVGALSAPK